MYIDWFCDECGCYMNDQPDFDTDTGTWQCTECGFINDVTIDNVIWYDENDEPICFDEDEDEDYEYEDEYLSVYDAAQIWASNGKDEDYTFGYTEEELERAL